MAAIDDALSAARGAHYGVIAACIGAVLFAATPDLSAPYRAARGDLEALRAINWAAGSDTVIMKAQLTPADSLRVWEEFVRIAGRDVGKREWRFTPSDREWWGRVPSVPRVNDQWTVAKLIEFGSTGAAKIRRPMVLRGRSLHDSADMCYKKDPNAPLTTGRPSKADTTTVFCSLAVRRNPDSTYLVTIGRIESGHGKKPRTLDSLQMESAEVVSPTLTISGWIQRHYSDTFVATTNGATRAARQKHGKGVALSNDTTKAFLPRLAAVQSVVGDLTPAQAAGVLEEKIAGSEQRMSAGGVPVGGNSVTVVGPLLLALALVYLFFQINHLAELAPGKEEPIRYFAWPLTFGGFPGNATALTTLLILPGAAVLLLMFRAAGHEAFSWSTSGLVTAILLTPSLAAGAMCLRARNQLMRVTGLNSVGARSGKESITP